MSELNPKYGFVTSLAMVVGSVVGIGIFLRAPRMSLNTGGDVLAVMLAWVIGAIMIIPIAIIIAEIASTVKSTGGMQIYGEETWGKRYGFTIGWVQSFFYIPGNLSFIMFLIAGYTSKVFHLNLNLNGLICLGLFYLLGLFCINIFAGKAGGYLQIVVTFVKIIPLLAIGIVGAFYFGDKVSTIGPNPVLLDIYNNNSHLLLILKIASIVPSALFALDGWAFVGVIAKEIKNPGRNVPLSIVGGLVIISVLYLLFTYASFNVVEPISLATEGASNIELATKLFGSTLANFINAFILISAIGVANGNVLVVIRGPYALAERRSFIGSSWLTKVNRHNIPANSGFLVLIVTLGYFLIPYLLGRTNDGNTYAMFIDSSILLFFVMYAIICFGVVRLRVTKPNLERPFKAPFIYVFIVLAVLGSVFGVFGLLVAYKNSIIPVVIFIACACSGFLVYSFTKEKEKSNL